MLLSLFFMCGTHIFLWRKKGFLNWLDWLSVKFSSSFLLLFCFTSQSPGDLSSSPSWQARTGAAGSRAWDEWDDDHTSSCHWGGLRDRSDRQRHLHTPLPDSNPDPTPWPGWQWLQHSLPSSNNRFWKRRQHAYHWRHWTKSAGLVDLVMIIDADNHVDVRACPCVWNALFADCVIV